jgi:ribosomal protein L12E/L44/L45/RPP1/RPP2
MFDAGFRIEALYSNGTDPKEVVDAKLVESAHTLLQPLMLRRLKRDVLSAELPPKIEKKIVVPLSSMQRFLYSAILGKDLSGMQSNGRKGSPKDWSRLNSLVMQLRKVCNHPYLFPEMDPMETDERMVEASSKLQVLDKILAKLQREGRKALIYSQFTAMLDVIGDFLSYRGYKFLRLDGSTPAARRRYEIACFENVRSPYFVYLISTRAGGLGITLVAADTVILYDSDWNPSADAQAMDRVHRIGQKKPVHCYRLCTKGTVEERILAAARHKTVMNALVMQDDVAQHAAGGKALNRDVSMKDLMSAIRDGVKCMTQKDTSTAKWEDLTIEEILDQAETKVVSAPPVPAAHDAAPDAGAAQKADAEQDDSHATPRPEAEDGRHGPTTETKPEAEAEEAGTAAEAKEDVEATIADLFQTLPEIRRFEGRHYSSRKEGFKDLAAQWLATSNLNDKRQVKERVVRVDGHNVMAWTLNSRTCAPASAPTASKHKDVMLHRRKCQRCGRSVGEFLMCSKCPMVMHKFCVKAEAWGVYTCSQKSSI